MSDVSQGPGSAPLGSIRWNKEQWDDPDRWYDNGDNWTFHADACGQPYAKWKQSLIDTFLEPYLGPEVDVIEIGPGHGRWTEFIVGRSHSLTLIDLSVSCIDVCRARFLCYPEASFIANDGRSLPVADASVDLIWSFGSFVHIDPQDIDAYLAEFRRVLRPGGRFVIHHAGWSEWSRRLVPITGQAGKLGRVLQRRLAEGCWRSATLRVAMSSKRFASMAADHGLCIDEQIQTWGTHNEFGLAFKDVITLGSLRQNRSDAKRRQP